MKKRWIPVTTLAWLLAWGQAALGLEVGQAAPDWVLPGRTDVLRLSDLKGKTVYLDFWASWCGPCKQSFPWMNDMQARYAAKGLRVVGINLDQKPEDAHRFLGVTPARFDVAFDPSGQSPRAYGIKGMPTSVLIGPDGKVRMIHSGFRDENRAGLEQHIKLVLQRAE
jgi:thiol-disulfide isomerase/thioredoxin